MPRSRPMIAVVLLLSLLACRNRPSPPAPPQPPAPLPAPFPTPIPAPIPAPIPGPQPTPVPHDDAALALIDAARRFPGAQGSAAQPQPLLMTLAMGHAQWLADHRTLGHQGFDARFQRIQQDLHATADEIAAETWTWQANSTLSQAGDECCKCWYQSPGHWAILSKPHKWLGAGMAKGSDGVWRGVMLFAD